MNGLFLETSIDVYRYFGQALSSVKPVWIGLMSVLSYLLFPEEAYVPAAIAVGIAVAIDIVTKFYSLIVVNGGMKKAFAEGHISSARLWQGSYRKVISYVIIMLLCGLSARVTMLTSIAVFISTFFYSLIFIREALSSLENLRDAGHTEVNIFIFWLKRKQKQVLETDNVVSPIEEAFTNQTNGITYPLSSPLSNPPIVEENNAGFPIIPQDQNRPTI